MTNKNVSGFAVLAGLSVIGAAVLTHGARAASPGPGFNMPGNILISDQYNNRVIEINRQGNIVFQFGSNNPTECNPGPNTVIAPNDVERLAHGNTLIAGTGAALPNFTCPDNRVFIVNKMGHIIWQYGQAGVTGSGPNQLNTPVFAIQTGNGDVLITDQGNNRILEVDAQHNVVMQYGPTSGPGALNAPNSAEVLKNGDILIADQGNNRALEITPRGNIVSQISGTFAGLPLNTVAFASRLPSGDTLITDSGNSRVLEITPAGKVRSEYFTNRQMGSNPAPLPSNAIRLQSGGTLITDQLNDRVLVIDPYRQIVFQYGMLDMPGNGPGMLNAPYNATVVGQYVGVTPPPGLSASALATPAK